MMRPTLHSHHGDDGVSVYSPSGGAPFPVFPTPAHPVDPALRHDIAGFDHNHGDERRLDTYHTHIQNHSPRLSSTSNPHHDHEEAPQQSLAPHAPAELRQSPPPALDVFGMLPPPAGTHPSWQALHDFAQSYASEQGYALSINTTAKNRHRIKLACVCYGAPKNTHKLTPETRVRKNRASYKTGCKMWVEGKKQEDGLWILRVGEPLHNHPGRPPEGWAVQRKRTWGIQNGKIGVGGVTAKEEKERLSSLAEGTSLPIEEGPEARSPKPSGNTSHSLESGGLVWRIVEQEMLRKRSPGQGRDRGVGRTVKILQERLPGIHIFKRDVYNIRAQIKRARKAAGQQIGDGLDESEEEEGAETLDSPLSNARSQRANPSEEEKSGKECSEIDPTLVAQCSDALQNVNRQETETHRLRDEVSELREALAQRTKEVEERDAEIESLRAQLGLANMALYNGRYSHAH